jgi:hypothetical protein
MDNRDLDKMIQEKLGDYREAPDPKVWDRVRNSLDQKKKKGRLIPLWLRLGAAAAVILAGLLWLAPEEDFSKGTPSVGGTATQPGTLIERNDQSPAAEETLPGTSEAVTPEKGLTGGETNFSAAPGEAGAVVSSSRKSDNPSGVGSGKGDRESDRLLASEAGKMDPALTDKNEGRAGQGRSPESPMALPRQADAVADSNTGQVDRDPEQKEKKQDEPELKDLPKKSIFDAIKPREAVAASESTEGKWSVGPSLAPVYFNSFGTGSPISSNFLNNAKSGTLNMSYGLQVSYQISKKLSLRSGLHRVDYGYNTDDVGFTSSPTARPSSLIRTISYSENSKSLVVHSTVGGGQPPQQPEAVDVSAPSPAREGQMLQEFGYLEIPIEMQYNLLDRKWGINLIGGLSSLFLVDNSVSLQSGETVTELGEATNMNSLNFSTNFGLGFYYRLTSSFEINLQPMFKYQLNTFSETSGSFQPYSIGVYSGLNFRF